jgi:hypothetical protein
MKNADCAVYHCASACGDRGTVEEGVTDEQCFRLYLYFYGKKQKE